MGLLLQRVILRSVFCDVPCMVPIKDNPHFVLDIKWFFGLSLLKEMCETRINGFIVISSLILILNFVQLLHSIQMIMIRLHTLCFCQLDSKPVPIGLLPKMKKVIETEKQKINF